MSEFDFDMVQNFLIALLLGALVGIEREKHRRDEHPNSFGGLETEMAQRLSDIEHCAMTVEANCILSG